MKKLAILLTLATMTGCSTIKNITRNIGGGEVYQAYSWLHGLNKPQPMVFEKSGGTFLED